MKSKDNGFEKAFRKSLDGAECVDTREKLERDIRFGSTMTMYSNSDETEVTAKWSDVMDWLDRQAAITTHEVSDSYEHVAERQSDRIFELHNKLADALERVDRLRGRADELRMLASSMVAPYIVPSTKLTMAYAMSSAESEMREAADTIEELSAKLQGVMGMRYNKLFGTPERAARTMQVLDPHIRCRDCAFSDSCDENDVCIYERDYDALLEWLRGDA